MPWALIGGFTGVLRLLSGAGIAFVLFMAWNVAFDNPGVRKEGRLQERAVWEEAVRKLRTEMEVERRAAQAAIDEIEAEYLEQSDRDRQAVESLEQTIEELDGANEGTPASGARFPKRLLRDLNAVGR